MAEKKGKQTENSIKFRNIVFEGLELKLAEYHLNKQRLEPSEGYDTIVVHHTGHKSSYSLESIYKVHVKENGFGAIGYHFVISRKGTIYYTRSLEYKGAHAFPNTGRIGIAFAYNLDERKPSAESVKAFIELADVLCVKYSIPPQGVIGHIQAQVRNANERMIGQGIETALTEEGILKAKSLRELMEIKRCEARRIEEIKGSEKVLPIIKHMKSCPGIMFYPILRCEYAK